MIITYYWPPAGGIGVHRCLKFAKYLRDFGWEPVIFTAKNAQYPDFDHSNFKHIPEGIEIHKIPIFEPFNIFRKLSGRKPADPANPVYVRDKKRTLIDSFSIWIRGNFFIPDARACWIRPAVRYISRYLKNNRVDAIFTDGPPHTNTRIGYHLARKHNIPWIADFQDPWTQVDYYKLLKIGTFADNIHRSMENGVFRTAGKITIASHSWGKDLEKIGAPSPHVIYYGYDDDDFLQFNKNQEDGLFIILHSGMLGIDRFPKVLFDVLTDMIKTIPGFDKSFKLKLLGQVDFEIQEYLKKTGLINNTVLTGQIRKDDAINEIIMSNVLLLPLNKAENVKGRIPGKLYEYLRAYKPILALGPENTDVGCILEDCKAGKVINYDEHEAIKIFILEKYKAFISNSEDFLPDKEKISFFSVKNQTGELAKILNSVIHAE